MGIAVLLRNVTGNQHVALSSPSLVLTQRVFSMCEALHLSGAAAPPLGRPREWVAEGTTYPDPLDVAFYMEGNKALRLNIYEADGVTLLRSEIFRVSTLPFSVTALAAPGSGSGMELSWSSIPGCSYQVEYAADLLAPVWLAAGSVTTALTQVTS